MNSIQATSRRCTLSRRPLFAIILAGVLALFPAIALGVHSSDEDGARGFVGSVAALVYVGAWPSAEYEGYSIKSLDAVPGGYDVLVKLTGKSSFGGGSLWLELVFEFRNGGLRDFRVRKHNAILMQPFGTLEAMGQLAAELANEYSTQSIPVTTSGQSPPLASRTPQQAAARKAGGVCLENPTDHTLTYSYRWGEGAWKGNTVKARSSQWHWWPYPGEKEVSPSFQIVFDSDLTEEGKRPVRRTLRRNAVSLPISSCKAARVYSFAINHRTLGVVSQSWDPGWMHPFAPFVVAAETKGNWKPAANYRWLDPDDNKSLRVVESDRGVLGLWIGRKEYIPYPVVTRVLARGPAEEAGLRTGQMILRIAGVSTVGKSLRDCAVLMEGPIGTVVDLEIRETGDIERSVVSIHRR